MSKAAATLALALVACAGLCLAGPVINPNREIRVGRARTLPLRISRGDVSTGGDDVTSEENDPIPSSDGNSTNIESEESPLGDATKTESNISVNSKLSFSEDAPVVTRESETDKDSALAASIESRESNSLEDKILSVDKGNTNSETLDLSESSSSENNSRESVETETSEQVTGVESSEDKSNDDKVSSEASLNSLESEEGSNADLSSHEITSDELMLEAGDFLNDSQENIQNMDTKILNPRSPLLLQQNSEADTEDDINDVNDKSVGDAEGTGSENEAVVMGVGADEDSSERVAGTEEEGVEGDEKTGEALEEGAKADAPAEVASRIASVQGQDEDSYSGAAVGVAALFVVALVACVALLGVYYRRMATPNAVALEGDDVTLYARGPQYQTWGRLPGYSID